MLTADVARRLLSPNLNRRWIGMDITYQAIAIILVRLEDQFSKEVADAVLLDGYLEI
jgi:hypothetical protein